jgi:putative transposase
MKELIFGSLRFSRTDVPADLKQLESWPTVDISALSENDLAGFKARCDAIRLFLDEANFPISSITSATGVQPAALYRVLKRCWTKHDDGQIYGFRGAIPYARFKAYARTAPVLATFDGHGGASGAFERLLNTYPKIRQLLLKHAKNRNKKIKGATVFRMSIEEIHQKFQQACRDEGIGPTEYPFSESRLAFRSVQKFFKQTADKDFSAAVAHAGGKKARAAVSTLEQAPAATRAFEVIQFDGHKIDLRLTVKMTDPHGFERLLEINRVWILVLLDVFTRAVIGYGLTLSKEYNKDDVAMAFQAALVPFKPRDYQIPHLAIRPGGGFPSAVIQRTAYACWDWFAIDGAKAHLAADTLVRLNEIVGCWTDNGPAGEPNARPFIERFFHLISKHFAHKLPGSLGNSPDSIEKLLCDVGGDLRLLVEYEELEDLIEVVVGNYNGAAHSGVGGRTPLEAMALSVERQPYLRTLPRQLRGSLCLLQEARVVTVKGAVKDGVRPHINFSNVKYTSDILADNAALIGKKIRIYYDVRDIRTVKAYFDDGSELGVLRAARPWCFTPHSLRVRQEIFRLLAEKKIALHDGDDPMEVWAKFKWAESKTSRKAANDLAKAHKANTLPAFRPMAQVETLVPKSTDTDAVVERRPETSRTEEPIKAKVLQIRRVVKF